MLIDGECIEPSGNILRVGRTSIIKSVVLLVLSNIELTIVIASVLFDVYTAKCNRPSEGK
jgi:hypothetical protein